MNKRNYIGVDVAKAKLDIFNDGKFSVIENNPSSISRFIDSLSNNDVVILEASGGYESLLASKLGEAQKPFCLENPRKIRDFAKAVGIVAKTDSLDARVISLYGEKTEPRLATPADIELCALVTRRDQLVEMRASEKNRREKAPKRLLSSIDSTIEHLTQQISLIDKEIQDYIDSQPGLKEKYQILLSYKGIGKVAAQVLLAFLPELGSLEKGQIASLAGLAPLNRDSGMMRGRRTIFGGRKRVRCALYISALVASRHNDIIKNKRAELALKNKPTKVILTACSRKILIHLNAMIKKKETFSQSYA